MKFSIETIKSSATQLAGKIALNAKEYAPEIALVGGIALVVAGGVLACKQTLKLETILETQAEKMEEIEQAVEDEVPLKDGKTYTAEDGKKDKTIIAVNTAAKIVKNYAVPAGLTVLGFTLIICGHKILRDRNTAMLAAYSALQTAYEAYRQRVVDKYGEDAEHDIYFGTHKEQVEVTRKNPETGTEETVLEEVDTTNCPLGNPWARVYDKDHSDAYDIHDNSAQDYNKSWLEYQQRIAEGMRAKRGYLFYNEVLSMLGYELVPEGQYYGWTTTPVNFGIFSSWTNPEYDNLFDGFKRTMILDFNVEPIPIIGKMPKGDPNGLRWNDPVAVEVWANKNK